ncbi:MAG: pantetheine-phosphate adenylyltransferase [Pseudomonadota bacterium]|nr:pantetheine-phosphate adenylyltransferase [Pseudomonadota bacterium]
MSEKQRVGLYPGTFDPITNGHIDIIRRASKIVDRLVIGVAINAGKGPLFTLAERSAMVQAEIDQIMADNKVNGNLSTIEVVPFETLLMHFAESLGADVIIRGLRAVSDFEYEFQMTSMNARLNQQVETVFLMASDRHQFIASRLVKEIGMLGGDVRPFLSESVADLLLAKIAESQG